MVINEQVVRRICTEMAKPAAPSLRELGEKLHISKDTVSKVLKAIEDAGKDPAAVITLSHAEIDQIIPLNEVRQNWIEPDWNEVFIYRFGTRNYRKPIHTMEETWRDSYVLKKFTVDIRSINRGTVKAALPDGCMPFVTFSRQFNDRHKERCPMLDDSEGTALASSISASSPGSAVMIDASGDPVYWRRSNGTVEKGVLYVAVLQYSGLTFAWIGPDHKLMTWMRFVIAMLKFYGGAPACIISDNEASICQRSVIGVTADGKELRSITINPSFTRITDPAGIEWKQCEPYKSRHKALGERTVKLYQDFGIPGQVLCRSREDLPIADTLEQLNEYLLIDVNTINDQLLKDRKFSRRAYFELYEREYLSPLPELDLNLPVDSVKRTVSDSGYARYKGNFYYAGTEHTGSLVQVEVFEDDTLKISLRPGLELLKTHKVDRGCHPRMQYIKSKSDYSDKEKYVSRSLEELTAYAHKHFPAVSAELAQVFTEFFAHSRMNDIHKTSVCNNILDLCTNCCSSHQEQLLSGLQHILREGVYDNTKMKRILQDYIGRRRAENKFASAQQELDALGRLGTHAGPDTTSYLKKLRQNKKES